MVNCLGSNELFGFPKEGVKHWLHPCETVCRNNNEYEDQWFMLVINDLCNSLLYQLFIVSQCVVSNINNNE